jgi:hypothetical protein
MSSEAIRRHLLSSSGPTRMASVSIRAPGLPLSVNSADTECALHAASEHEHIADLDADMIWRPLIVPSSSPDWGS